MRLHLLAALSLMLIGCASSGPKIDEARLTEVRKGETTIADVVSRFGRPSILSKNMNGTQTAVYMHAGGRSDAAAFVPLMAALVGNADANVDSVIFYFDVKGVLSDYKTTQAQARMSEPAEAERAMQANTNNPAPTDPANPTQTVTKKTAQTDKKPAGDSNPWTIQLYPSGYRENR
jgi:hypothetical protein